MRFTLSLLFVLDVLAPALHAQGQPSEPGNTGPGGELTPGQVHRWIVRLTDAPVLPATFDERHRGMSPAESAALRHEEISILEREYLRARTAAEGALAAANAVVIRDLPQIHTMIVEMTPEAATALAATPWVAAVAADVRIRGQLSMLAPSDAELAAPEHHGAEIAHRLGFTGANRNALLGILDYSLRDNYTGVSRPHQTLHVGGSASNSSRVLVDANPIGSPLWNGTGARPFGVDHGVRTAGFAAGAACVLPSAPSLSDGQAPGAGLVGVNITTYYNVQYACGGQVFRDVGFFSTAADMATGLNWLAANPTVGTSPVRVACLAFGGPTNPDHALSLAIDGLAVNAGILVVTPSSNYAPGSNNPYESFNHCNGLCVGGTDKAPGPMERHPVDPGSGQGPLTNMNTALACAVGFSALLDPTWRMPVSPQGDVYRREFPDIAAISAASFGGRTRDETKAEQTSGTSISSAIVAGAATLYLNGRDGGSAPTTSILEAKAALLATAFNTNPGGAGDNQRGAGFLRADRLTNDPMTDALTTTSTATVDNRQGWRQTVATFTAIRNRRHSVALTWFRTDLNPGLLNGAPRWADVDMAVYGSSSGLLAVVASRVNAADTFGNRTWERFEFVANQTETITVEAVVNREAPGSAPITVGVATCLLAPPNPAPSASITAAPGMSAAPCAVLQTVSAGSYTSLPAGVTFEPQPLGMYRQIALAISPEVGGPTSSNVIRVELRGRFARSTSIPCRMVGATTYDPPLGANSCPLPPGAVLAPDSAGTKWDSVLVIDAAAGVATAEFTAIGGSGPRYLVFDASPEMAFLMPRTGGFPAPCGYVPWSRNPFVSFDAFWVFGALPVAGSTVHRATYPVTFPTPGICNQWECGSFYYDLTVSSGVTTPSPGATLTVVPGLPSLRATGTPIPGHTYNLVVEGGEQGPALELNTAVIVSDFSGSEVALGPPGCMSIYKPATSVLSSNYVFGDPSNPQLQSSLSVPIATPFDPSLIGQQFFQQAVLLSFVGGSLQIVPTAHVVAVEIGW